MARVAIASFAFSIAIVIYSGAIAQEKANSKKHFWSKIAYPAINCKWGIDKKIFPTIRPTTNAQGLEFELLIRGPKEKTASTFDFPFPADFDARLHVADGRVRGPTRASKKLLKAGTAKLSNGMHVRHVHFPGPEMNLMKRGSNSG